MTATYSTVTNVLKRRYPQRRVTEMLYKNAPLLAALKKNEQWTGSTLDISIQYSNTGGGSATFSDAQGNKNPNNYARMQVTDVTDYSLFGITTQALRSCGNDAGALVRKVDQEMSGAMNTIRRSMAIGVYRNFGGAIGRISSGGATTTLTLTNRADIVNFEVGMTIDCDDVDGTSGAVDGDPVRITAISRSAGTISKTGAAWNASGNYADNDYLFREGDFGLKIYGLASWVPTTAPTSGDSFFGLDRSADVERLAGHRYTASIATDGTVLNAIRRAANNQAWLGGMPNVCYMHPMVFDSVCDELGDKVVYDKLSARDGRGDMASVSFDTVKIMTSVGPMQLVADMNCPYTLAYMLDMECWTLHSRGPLAGWLDDDGKGKLLRESTSDSMEGRIGSFHQLVCDNPGSSGVIDLSATGLLPTL